MKPKSCFDRGRSKKESLVVATQKEADDLVLTLGVTSHRGDDHCANRPWGSKWRENVVQMTFFQRTG